MEWHCCWKSWKQMKKLPWLLRYIFRTSMPERPNDCNSTKFSRLFAEIYPHFEMTPFNTFGAQSLVIDDRFFSSKHIGPYKKWPLLLSWRHILLLFLLFYQYIKSLQKDCVNTSEKSVFWLESKINVPANLLLGTTFI